LANGGSSLDPQQDYDLIGAHENETHTVMRFRRKLVTCDDKDLNITVIIKSLFLEKKNTNEKTKKQKIWFLLFPT
jgi:hypothetical protein